METFDHLARYKIFLAVAEYKSTLKVTAQLFIFQRAVSIAIKKLEEHFNNTLFIRTVKGVELTESGRKLYENANRAFQI